MSPHETVASLEDLLMAASSRQPWVPDDTKSGARFERVVIDGERYVLKYQDPRDDWLLRATGDPGERYVRLWEIGLLGRMPDVIDSAVVACSFDGAVGRVLLRDVSDPAAPARPAVLDRTTHPFCGSHGARCTPPSGDGGMRSGLTPLAVRYLMFSPAVAQAEAALGSEAVVPTLMAQGWARLPAVSTRLADLVLPLLDDPSPLVAALGAVPHTLVHGDWKAANLGSHPDGRTVLLDFGEVPGEASPIADLSWYLALNADLLPETKDQAISSYRGALQRHGIDTAGWWDAAVALELLGHDGPVRVGEGARRPGSGTGLVGGTGSRGCAVAMTTAYDGLAHEWDAAAGVVYRPLARSLVAASPVPLAGRLVLDVGSGTGAVAQAAAARGARVVAIDRSDRDGQLPESGRAGRSSWLTCLRCRCATVCSTPLSPDSCSITCRRVQPWPSWSGWCVPAERSSPRPGRGTARLRESGDRRRRGLLGLGPPAWYQAMREQVKQVSGNPERLTGPPGRRVWPSCGPGCTARISAC